MGTPKHALKGVPVLLQGGRLHLLLTNSEVALDRLLGLGLQPAPGTEVLGQPAPEMAHRLCAALVAEAAQEARIADLDEQAASMRRSSEGSPAQTLEGGSLETIRYMVASGLGVTILSTSRGLMTDKDARRHKVGGEIVCEVW